ncbi:DNA internalization-related competence protein ComEC/Rec2 [Halomonas pacifica]|uniref:DNA internalization-related competence protein ComEC/Rec2 n=1 Tax=Bisbaumannia pacifica TaxID=77098 RepID=UPI00235A4700|nr:DNA internalization-related competence protein ComEC/Rec2 [Halomonas pacifica]MDC8804269.1 DNA internalization-related competence protein ComEC/Rec2 [Halomonas pacifica]
MRIGWAWPLALAAIAGTLLGYLAPPGLIEAGVLLALGLRRHRGALLLLLVVSVTAGQLLWRQQAELAEGLSRQTLVVEGRLTEVRHQGALARLRLDVAACVPLEAGRLPCDTLRQLRLSHYAPPDEMAAGESWRLAVRLRPPAGLSNPSGFDYRAWLWREGIDATGYVRAEPVPERLAPAAPSPRDLALAHLASRELPDSARRWLAALTLGASESLTPADWERLNATGTTHLVVISGLHVGLVAGFALLLGRGVARLVTPRAWRLALWPWWLAALAAGAYAGLAGLAPPALRALVMALIGLWVASGRHAPGPWQGWWLALALVLLLDPLSLWRPGLWLSFLAVALLILIWQGRPRPRGVRGWLWALVRTQWLLAPWMAAAVLLAFDRLATAAPLVNLLAVPLVSLALVPLGLLGWLLAWAPPLSGACWWLFAELVVALEALLEASLHWLPPWFSEPWERLPLALGLGLLALTWALPGLARGWRALISAWLMTLPLWLTPPVPASGEATLRVWDVGQGQAVEIATANHRLLYDAGPRFTSGYTPLAGLWPPGRRFDRVIISHADLDHAGGVPALAEHRVGDWLAPRGEAIGVPFAPCQAGQAWRWDGVDFRLLWPPPGSRPAYRGNDSSCVLLVSAGERRVLITGDVGREVERRILRQVPTPLDVLVAGHHGSRGSSGPQFVERLRPRLVIYSAGRDNPFGHPDDEVVRRFARQGSCQWSTALDGALTLRLGPETRIAPQRRIPWAGVGGRCHGVESPPWIGLGR